MHKFTNFFECYNYYKKEIMQNGSIVNARGLYTQEIINASFCISNHNLYWPNDDCDKPKKSYIKAEKKWYNSATLKVNGIEQYGTIWKKIKSNFNNVNSNYGYYVWNRYSCGMNQFEFVINELRNDKLSRRAVININAIEHKYINNNDMPCTIAIQFLIRNNKLNTIIFMRSNDLYYGFRNDVPWFVYLAKRVAKDLNIKLGDYYHTAASLHIYLKKDN